MKREPRDRRFGGVEEGDKELFLEADEKHA